MGRELSGEKKPETIRSRKVNRCDFTANRFTVKTNARVSVALQRARGHRSEAERGAACWPRSWIACDFLLLIISFKNGE